MRKKNLFAIIGLTTVMGLLLLGSCDPFGPQNEPPVADDGPDQTVQVGDQVMLDGKDSSDRDGDSLTYLWVFASRPPITILNNASISGSTSKTAYFTPDVERIFDVDLTVDDRTDSNTDTVRITVEAADTQVDTTPPQITSVSPADDTTGVAVTNAVSVTFSEQMETTVTEGAFSLKTGETSVTGSFSWSGTTMTFAPPQTPISPTIPIIRLL